MARTNAKKLKIIAVSEYYTLEIGKQEEQNNYGPMKRELGRGEGNVEC